MNRKVFALALAVLMLAGLGLVFIPAQANTPNYGDVDGNGVINSADVTLLRRRVAQGNENNLPSNYNRANADVNGDGTIDAADVTLLRRHVAATNPSTVPLGPRPSGYFISFTADDGPKGAQTTAYLDNMRTLNQRSQVVCGKNPQQFGVLPCRAGVGCGTACGTVSRAHMTFYVNGKNNSSFEEWTMFAQGRPLAIRILQEGHELANHTTSHPNLVSYSSASIIAEINETEAIINHALTRNYTVSWDLGQWTPTTTTDFYGRTYSASNPFKSHSFRPGFFSIGQGAFGVDSQLNMPWIFAGLDVDDWRGHTAQQMSRYLLDGNFNCPRCGTAWCSIGLPNGIPFVGVRNKADAADGGIILVHDGSGAWEQGATMLTTLIPEMQDMNYHFVTVEKMFEFMDAEPAWIPSTVNPGQGDGTRVNDWVIRGARRTGPGPRPHIKP
jgi:peptidoglycan/xylan/chitin deacetylase (PgdA/CDA1 family)